MEIQLNTPKKIILVKEVSVMATSIHITTIDDGNMVEAKIIFKGPEGEQEQIWTLWDGQDYINIGQWTDTDVQNRIKELIPEAF